MGDTSESQGNRQVAASCSQGTVLSEILWGRHVCQAVLQAGRRPVHRLLLREGSTSDLQGLCQQKGIRVSTASTQELDRLVPTGRRVNVAIETAGYPFVSVDELPTDGGRLWLALDHLEDAGNMGAILRTAGAAGVDGVLLPKVRSAPLSPTAQFAAAGVAETLRIAKVANLAQSLERLKKRGAWIYGLDMDGQDLAQFQPDENECKVLVLGGEGKGLSRLVADGCDGMLKVSMADGVESLNASVAAALALYKLSGRL